MSLFYDFNTEDLTVTLLLSYLRSMRLIKSIDIVPFAFLRCIYKLITNVLTIWLEPFSDKMISMHLNAFFAKRNIMDGIVYPYMRQ